MILFTLEYYPNFPCYFCWRKPPLSLSLKQIDHVPYSVQKNKTFVIENIEMGEEKNYIHINFGDIGTKLSP